MSAIRRLLEMMPNAAKFSYVPLLECLLQIMIIYIQDSVRARARTTRSGVQRANH